MQLIELNLLAGFDGVVDTDGDGNQQEANVTFPNGSHDGNSPHGNYEGENGSSKRLICATDETGPESIERHVEGRCASPRPFASDVQESFASARSITLADAAGMCGARSRRGTAGCSKMARIVSLTLPLLVRLSAQNAVSRL
jgi:hypothetical protein